MYGFQRFHFVKICKSSKHIKQTRSLYATFCSSARCAYPHKRCPADCRWRTDSAAFSSWKSVRGMQSVDCSTRPSAPNCPNRTECLAGPEVSCRSAEWIAGWPAASARRAGPIWSSPSNKSLRGWGHTWATPLESRGTRDSSNAIFCSLLFVGSWMDVDAANSHSNTLDSRIDAEEN